MNKLTLDKLLSWAFLTYGVIYLMRALSSDTTPFFDNDHALVAGICTPFALAFGYMCAVGWKLLGKLHEKLFN